MSWGVLVAPPVLEPDPALAILAPVQLTEHVKLTSTARAEQVFNSPRLDCLVGVGGA